MDKRFDGKVALVTGGTTGIGLATVHRLAVEGAHVVFCARSDGAGVAIESDMTGRGQSAWFIHCDITDEGEVESLFATIAERLGRVDVIVANAGAGDSVSWPMETSESWMNLINLNLTGSMCIARGAWPHLITGGGGSLVFISSLSAVMAVGRDQLAAMGGIQPSAGYQASKAGLEGLAIHLAGRGGEHNIRVNTVRPGRILTDKWRELLGEDGLFWSHYQTIQILKRQGTSEDVAAAVAFLASEDAAFITGKVLDVDGGAITRT